VARFTAATRRKRLSAAGAPPAWIGSVNRLGTSRPSDPPVYEKRRLLVFVFGRTLGVAFHERKQLPDLLCLS
jgi:hypothetical protein